MPQKAPDKSTWHTSMREAGPYLGLGVQFALTMAFFTLGGYGLDYWLGTSPWLTIGGALLGMTALFIQLFRVAGTLGSKKGTSSKSNPSENTPPPGRPLDT
ncbi:MAG: AtpZ/AtpI family protein [Rhodothermales bacterium]